MGVSAVVGGAILGSAVIGANAGSDAADAQVNASNNAQALQYKMFQEQKALLEPWRKAGEPALERLSTGFEKGGEFSKPFSLQDFYQSPSYNFQLQQGQQEVTNANSARGNTLSGAQLQGANVYAQNLASTNFQQSYANWAAERATQINGQSQLSSWGQAAAANQAAAAGNYAANTGNLMLQSGNAQASGIMGEANAYSNALNQFSSLYTMGAKTPQTSQMQSMSNQQGLFAPSTTPLGYSSSDLGNGISIGR